MLRIASATCAALSNKPATCPVDAPALADAGTEMTCTPPDNGRRRSRRRAMWQLVAPAWRRKRVSAGRWQIQFLSEHFLCRK